MTDHLESARLALEGPGVVARDTLRSPRFWFETVKSRRTASPLTVEFADLLAGLAEEAPNRIPSLWSLVGAIREQDPSERYPTSYCLRSLKYLCAARLVLTVGDSLVLAFPN